MEAALLKKTKKHNNNNIITYDFTTLFCLLSTLFCQNSETHRIIAEVWNGKIFGSVSKKNWTIPKDNVFDKRTRDKNV